MFCSIFLGYNKAKKYIELSHAHKERLIYIPIFNDKISNNQRHLFHEEVPPLEADVPFVCSVPCVKGKIFSLGHPFSHTAMVIM